MTPENAYEAFILKRRLEYLECTDYLLPLRNVINTDWNIPLHHFKREYSDINTFDSFMSCLIKGRKNANANPNSTNIQTVHGKDVVAGAANVNSVSANTAA